MKLATTTGDFSRFFIDHKERVKHVADAGFRYIDLSMYTIFDQDPLFCGCNWQDYAKELADYTASLGAKFVQAHSPGGNPLSCDVAAQNLLEATIRSIDVCGALGIPNIVVHAGVLPDISKAQSFKLNCEFFNKLIPAMERNGVNVLCENSTAANTGSMYFTNSGADIKEFVEYVNHPLFHACWDTGHGNIEGSQYDEIMAVGRDLFAVHINDNRGVWDEHILPFCGTTNFGEIINALIDCEFKGYFTFECDNAMIRASQRRSFDRDNRLLEPQLFMQKHLERLMYEIGEYALKAYNCFEE